MKYNVGFGLKGVHFEVCFETLPAAQLLGYFDTTLTLSTLAGDSFTTGIMDEDEC